MTHVSCTISAQKFLVFFFKDNHIGSGQLGNPLNENLHNVGTHKQCCRIFDDIMLNLSTPTWWILSIKDKNDLHQHSSFVYCSLGGSTSSSFLESFFQFSLFLKTNTVEIFKKSARTLGLSFLYCRSVLSLFFFSKTPKSRDRWFDNRCLNVRMLHDIYDMDVIISHQCHKYFFNK